MAAEKLHGILSSEPFTATPHLHPDDAFDQAIRSRKAAQLEKDSAGSNRLLASAIGLVLLTYEKARTTISEIVD